MLYRSNISGETFEYDEIVAQAKAFYSEAGYEDVANYMDFIMKEMEVIESLKFEEYGELEWVEPEEFYEGKWILFKTRVEGPDEEVYDILFNAEDGRLGYSNF